jgi:hypothetical protein
MALPRFCTPRTTRPRSIGGIVAVAVALGPVFAFAVPASAAPGGCPRSASGFVRYDVVGTPGDPAPAPGEDPLWDLLAESAAEEGFTLEDFVVLEGLPGLDEFYALVVGGWLGWDTNGDAVVCVKRFPAHQQGAPAYAWNIIDNNAQIP